MPIKKETPTRLVKYGATYAVIPSTTIALVGDAVALGILVYLMDKPENWIPRKKDICKALKIGDDRWKKATTLLSDCDLYMVTNIRNELGHYSDRVVTVSAVPMGLLPKCGKPDLGKTQIGKTPPINITDTKHNITLSKGFKRPTVEEVAEYCKEKGYTIDPETFVNHYESNGWKVGNNSMKNWKAATTTWNKREKDSNHGKHQATGRGNPSRGQTISATDLINKRNDNNGRLEP